MKLHYLALPLAIALICVGDYAGAKLINADKDYDTIPQTEYFKIIGDDETREYEYYIYDSKGNIVENESVKGLSPGIKYISGDVIEIRFHGGPFADLCRYYNVQSDKMSADFWNPFLIADKNIIYYDGESKKLIVQNIFDKSIFFREFAIDMILTGGPESIEFIDNGQKLKITYMRDSDYEYETQILDLNK